MDRKYPYPIIGPSMDAGRNPTRLENGLMSRCVGVDGRFRGAAKPFPGMVVVKSLVSIDAAFTNPTFFDFVEFQKGAATDYMRGYIVRYGATNATQSLVFFYYDTAAATWSAYDIGAAALAGSIWTAGTVTSTVLISTTYNTRFCYIAVEGNAALTFYHNGTNFVLAEMGPGAAYEDLSAAVPTVDTETDGVTGYNLQYGATYAYSYRFFNTTRKMFSDMSGLTYVTVGTTTSGHAKFRFQLPAAAAVPAAYDTLYVYRTIDSSTAGVDGVGGYSYVEQMIDAATFATGVGTTNSCWVGTAADAVLATLDRYDPNQDTVGMPGKAGAIINYQNTTLMAEDPASTLGGTGFRWTSVYSYDPENFHISRRYKGETKDGKVIRFIVAGDACYAFTPNVIYRIQKNGGQLTITRLHLGFGLVAAYAGHSVGRDCLCMGSSGLGVLDGMDGNLQEIGAVDRIIYKYWKGYLDKTHSAFDAEMAVSFFGNTQLKECICVWHSAQSITMLEDYDFSFACTGPLPTAGGVLRAQFLLPSGAVVCPDTAGTGSRTMTGLSAAYTLNGTATGGTTATLVDTTATFNSSMVGSRVRFLGTTSGNGAYTTNALSGAYALITGVTNSNHTLQFAAQSIAPAVGQRYTISCVPMKLRFSTVPASSKEVEAFERRVIQGAAMHSVNLTGITNNPNALWIVTCYHDQHETFETQVGTVPVAAQIVMTETAPLSYGHFAIDGAELEPTVQVFAANVDYELTDLKLYGILSVSEDFQ